MKRKKTIALASVVLLAAAVLLAACSDGSDGEAREAGEGASITISLGRDASRTAVPWATGVDDVNVLHDIYIDGNRVGTSVKIGDGVKTYAANPGGHTVSVRGYYPAGTLFSYGETPVTVTSGQRAKCTITMLAPSGLLELSGSIAISPATGVSTGTELTATYSGGNETVSYQWKNGRQ